MSYPLELTGNVILITGGAQGIGKATAELCAERGAAVVIADFNKDETAHVRATTQRSPQSESNPAYRQGYFKLLFFRFLK